MNKIKDKKKKKEKEKKRSKRDVNDSDDEESKGKEDKKKKKKSKSKSNKQADTDDEQEEDAEVEKKKKRKSHKKLEEEKPVKNYDSLILSPEHNVKRGRKKLAQNMNYNQLSSDDVDDPEDESSDDGAKGKCKNYEGSDEQEDDSQEYDEEEESEDVPDEHDGSVEKLVEVLPPHSLRQDLRCPYHHGQLIHSYLNEQVNSSQVLSHKHTLLCT